MSGRAQVTHLALCCFLRAALPGKTRSPASGPQVRRTFRPIELAEKHLPVGSGEKQATIYRRNRPAYRQAGWFRRRPACRQASWPAEEPPERLGLPTGRQAARPAGCSQKNIQAILDVRPMLGYHRR